MASYESDGALHPGRRSRAGAAPSLQSLRPMAVLCALVAVELSATVAMTQALGNLAPDLDASGAVGFEAILAVAAGVAAWLCLTWLTVGAVLLTLAALPAAAGELCGRLAKQAVPPVLRRAAGAMLGASVLGVPTLGVLPAAAAGYPVPAPVVAAASVGVPVDGSHPRPASYAPGPLPSLDRPAAPSARHRSPPRRNLPRRVVVRAGDSLWTLAERSLGPRPSDAAVAVTWRRWYAANRTVIGPDPDLILPGQVLSPPAGNRAARPRPSVEENP